MHVLQRCTTAGWEADQESACQARSTHACKLVMRAVPTCDVGVCTALLELRIPHAKQLLLWQVPEPGVSAVILRMHACMWQEPEPGDTSVQACLQT
jgi:hypothetical protein